MQTPNTRVLLPSLVGSLPFERPSHWKAELFSSRGFPPLSVRHPTAALLLTPTVLLELFAFQAVTGSPGATAARPLPCSIMCASFKRGSLRPSVTSGQLPGNISVVGLSCSSSPRQILLPPDHQALIPTLSRTPKGLWRSHLRSPLHLPQSPHIPEPFVRDLPIATFSSAGARVISAYRCFVIDAALIM